MTLADITGLKKRSAENALENENEILGLNCTDIPGARGVQRQTVFRYRKFYSVPYPEVQERMAQIWELLYLQSGAFDDCEAQLGWFFSPAVMLRDRL